jgi:hypothetical protein
MVPHLQTLKRTHPVRRPIFATCSDILVAAVNVFGRNFPWRFGAIWPKLIQSQINRNG